MKGVRPPPLCEISHFIFFLFEGFPKVLFSKLILMIMWRVTYGQTDMVLYIYRWHSNSHVGWTESNDIMMWSVSCVVSEEGDAPTEGESCLEIMQIPSWTFGSILSSFTVKIVTNLKKINTMHFCTQTSQTTMQIFHLWWGGLSPGQVESRIIYIGW